jgi:two-component system sensor histidine kinase KdpD
MSIENIDSQSISSSSGSARRYIWALLACGATAAIATPLRSVLDLANILMLFLLTVLLVALRLGRGPAIIASFLSVALFDFFFVPPRFSFAVNDVQYLVTFAVTLAVALITAHLTAGLQQQALLASHREQDTRALYELARDLAGAASIEQVATIAEKFLLNVVNAYSILLLPDERGALHPATGGDTKLDYLEERLAILAYDRGEPVSAGALADIDAAVTYIPLKAPMRVRGTLAVRPRVRSRSIDPLMPLLTTVASLVAIAVERLHYVQVAGQAQVEMASERLRNSILSALSHDVRTPLTALVGLADSLALAKPPLPDTARETAEAIREQATRMSGMVSNLLDMARLRAGPVTPKKEWQLLEEVIGGSVQLLRHALVDHPVNLQLPQDMPLIEFDAVLMERVFCNLLENAAKYTPPGTPIDVAAHLGEGFVHVAVMDRGMGFPRGKEEAVFEMFVRGETESNAPGTGLGLAICRAIVESHGGTIHAQNRAEGGAQITFTLPMGSPPSIDEEPEPLVGATSDE